MKEKRYSKFTCLVACLIMAVGILFGVSSVEADLLVSDFTSVLRYDQTTGAFLGVLVPSGSGGLDNAQGSAFGPDGNLYVASFGSRNILRYDGVTGAFIDVFAPSGSGGLGAPSDVTFGPDGNLYVADAFYGTNSILRYNGHTGAFIDVFATGGGIQQPQRLTFGPDGNLFVGNATSSDVLRYHGATGLAYPAAGQSGAIFVPGSQGPFNTCIAFGPDGNLYVGSGASPDILRYDGTTGAFLGTFVPNGYIPDVNAGNFRFGPDGNLYVANYLGQSVLRYNGMTGAFIDTFVAPGSGGLGRPSGLVFTPTAGLMVWNLAADFRVSPNQENPNRDRYGNLDVWYFLESDANTFPDHTPSTYTLLPEFINDVLYVSGLEQWQGTAWPTTPKDRFPSVGINNTGSTQSHIAWTNIVWPPGVICVHPLSNKFAIVGWRSPITGAVMVTGRVNDLDDSCGDGILWSIDHFKGATNNTTLASGSIPEGGSQDFQNGIGGAGLASITVNQGDFLYFLVAPNSYMECDSTELTVSIRPTVNPPVLVKTTTWGHHTSEEGGGSIRGLAYDGHYYYIADHSDYLIDGRPWDFTGRIYIYDENGFVKRLPKNPPIRGTGFPHGVATDGTKLWTTDYFGGNIYEYKIASGKLLRTFISPISQPIRLDFDPKTRTLWMTGYDNPNIYQVDLNGTIVSSFPTSGLGLNKNAALDGKGGMLVASSEGNKENIHLLRRYSISGTLLEEYSNFYTAYWAMATNINDRYSGFIQDTAPIFNSNTGKYEAHIQHYSFTQREVVSIDIKPGSFPNSINPRSKGVIPVAILTTDTFDATTVDPLSVKFGPDGATEAHGRGHREDVNRDGKKDLVLHFRTQDTGIVCGDTSASLTGETFSGQAIEGSDSIRTVGCKSK